ncbi:MAG: class I SAM-dependent methyltransferase [Cyanobacteria bacterium SZAS LIN-2]|nr:class I SAM-dependent methyltransferase [Cyanobacteria bacterium SZAS LIN-2]MBS2006479.1 class I SAM-dependent methyltransferase [Cyanobacteria bacterium SZAS TMP-1]
MEQAEPQTYVKTKREAFVYELIAAGFVPDLLIRLGIMNMLGQKIQEETRATCELQQAHTMAMVEELKASPIAIETDAANEQHYQVHTDFFKLCLGKRLKYSCAYYTASDTTLDQAEEAMLALTVSRARVENGHKILELGCGWGSLTLYMAERFPDSQIVAVSNSSTQRAYIEGQCLERNLKNVRVITEDMNTFNIDEQFDRVVSVEMFEHMKNYQLLMKKISLWLKPGGFLFVHIFTHKTLCYHYQDKDGTDWMTRNFFSGGIMPSNDLLLYFQDDLRIVQQWVVSGEHYEKTANHWLENMDRNKEKIMPILALSYGTENQMRWWYFWRLFFMACAELWGYESGQQWMVSHYLFKRPN